MCCAHIIDLMLFLISHAFSDYNSTRAVCFEVLVPWFHMLMYVYSLCTLSFTLKCREGFESKGGRGFMVTSRIAT